MAKDEKIIYRLMVIAFSNLVGGKKHKKERKKLILSGFLEFNYLNY